MNDLIGKTPFVRLLLPVITGIIVNSAFSGISGLISWTGFTGFTLMLFSFFIPKEKQFPFRWIFGTGIFAFIFALTSLSYQQHEKHTKFTFSDSEIYYTGVITDIPEVKPRSIACNIKTTHPVRKKIVVYLQQTDEARTLQTGEEIVFFTKIQPFRNFGNPDDFDYERFMKIKGFTGSSYIAEANWQRTGREQLTIPIAAQRVRARILHFYQSFQFDPDAYAFISAITLGYKADLTDDLKEAFRASGTAHVLAVSGFHVGIIYMVINLAFSFLGKSGKKYIIRQIPVILALWGYIFVTGMPVSAVRAATMLTISCVGSMLNQKGFTYNTLCAAAFFILIFYPFSLFEIGFQMSFGAVFAILFFQPKLNTLYSPKNRTARYVWNLFTVSVAAQLGVFPIVLHYFGTFPTYFFITNVLVVPLIGVIIYAIFPLFLLEFLNQWNILFFNTLYDISHWILKTLTQITLRIVYFSETLPFAELSDHYISLLQLLLIVVSIVFCTHYIIRHRFRELIVALFVVFVFLLTETHEKITRPAPQLVVFNVSGSSEIHLFANDKRHYIGPEQTGFIPHPEKRILRLSDDFYTYSRSESHFPVDILILSQNGNFKVEDLVRFFNPGIIVLDSSVPRYAALRLASECLEQGIEIHDVAQTGAYSINF